MAVYCVTFNPAGITEGSNVTIWPGDAIAYTPSCDRSYVFVDNVSYYKLVSSVPADPAASGASGASTFYADSNALFYLFLAGAVSIYALKNFVQKLFFAS